MKPKLLTLTLLFIICGNKAAFSQDLKSSTYGFSIGLFGKNCNWSTNSSYFKTLNEAAPGGFGFGAKIGYGFTEKLEASIGYSKSNHLNKNNKAEWSDYSSQLLQLDLRVNFGATLKPVRLYLQAGAGQSVLKMDPVYFDYNIQPYLLKLSGIGIDAGAGLLYYPIRNLAIDLGFFGSFGKYSAISASGISYNPGETTDFQFLTTQLGITYYLQ